MMVEDVGESFSFYDSGSGGVFGLEKVRVGVRRPVPDNFWVLDLTGTLCRRVEVYVARG
jgi:hypothetical protein